MAADGNPQIEMNPDEWRSWNKEIEAFIQTSYLEMQMNTGKPAVSGSCIQNYENLEFILGLEQHLHRR